MARTKGKPGPKPKYGEREEIHVAIPVDDLQYIRSVTNNVTEWIIQAIQMQRWRETPPVFSPDGFKVLGELPPATEIPLISLANGQTMTPDQYMEYMRLARSSGPRTIAEALGETETKAKQ